MQAPYSKTLGQNRTVMMSPLLKGKECPVLKSALLILTNGFPRFLAHAVPWRSMWTFKCCLENVDDDDGKTKSQLWDLHSPSASAMQATDPKVPGRRLHQRRTASVRDICTRYKCAYALTFRRRHPRPAR
jgi:hypothetical protein